MPSVSDSNMTFLIHPSSLHLSSLPWKMNTWWGEKEERLTNRQLRLQKLLDKLSEGYCVKTYVMICISSQCTNRTEGKKKVISMEDRRLLFYCLLASFIGMVDPSDKPYLTIKNLRISGKFLFQFADFSLMFVQCQTKWGMIIWIADHMNKEVEGIDLCYTNKYSVKYNFQLLCQVTPCEVTG